MTAVAPVARLSRCRISPGVARLCVLLGGARAELAGTTLSTPPGPALTVGAPAQEVRTGMRTRVKHCAVEVANQIRYSHTHMGRRNDA
eukprot:COSAG02_NODE_173_length_31245_cov_413.548096_9_plen_88_part_00